VQPCPWRMVPLGLLFLLDGLFLLRGDAMRVHKAVLLLFLSLGVSGAAKADCTSASCSDCQTNRRGVVSCVAVTYSASCSCSISANNTGACTLSGVCTYSAGGGGGTGGGGNGGGSGGCVSVGGSWCPAECTSCTTVFF
jgi:hypothetical protein